MKLGRRGSKSKSVNVVGLDLDPSHIAAAEVDPNGMLSVTKGAVAHLRPGVLRDGEVTDPAALTDSLRAMWAEHGLSDNVRVGIANQRIVVRTLDLPPLEDEKALAAAVKVEAPDHIPMPMDEAVIDYQPLGLVETPQGPRSRVVVVAVRRDTVDRLVEAVREAGLTVAGVDLSAFGMVRALAPTADEAGKLYVNVSGLTNVAVANATGCLFTRAATGGLDAMVNSLSERRGLTLEHARQWMGHVGLQGELESIEGDPEVVAATRGVLEEGVHQLADTVRNSLNFFRMQEGSVPVENGVLVGPAVALPGFAERLSEQLHMPITTAQILADPDVGPEEADRHRLTVAAGLAIEEVA